MTTREEWLQNAVAGLEPLFAGADVNGLPEVHVSIGWPGGRGKKGGVIGQCWAGSMVADGKPAIFLSPVLSQETPERVLGVLVHELVHALGNHGHRGSFARLAARVGLTAPWTATSEGPELAARLRAIAETLGPFPHAVINPGARPIVQTTRMLKVVCPDDGYTVRTTAKWLAVGLPSCPCGIVMEQD